MGIGTASSLDLSAASVLATSREPVQQVPHQESAEVGDGSTS